MKMQNTLSRSQEVIQRGYTVTSSERADLEGTYDFVIEKGKGAYVWDMEGKRYIDFTASTGAVILGYNPEEVNQAVIEQITEKGSIFPTTISELHVNLAEWLIHVFKGFNRVLFFRTGSCATTAAVRLARIHTKKHIVLTSGYHGWHDWHLNIFPRFVIQDPNHLEFRYNLNLLRDLLKTHQNQVACVIITPEPNFFDKDYFVELKEICEENNVLLIFDEVMCGFRLNLGGFYAKIGVQPDMITIGKGLANGYALSAVIGKEDIMRARDETHLVGTFHNDQSPMAAALATLTKLEKENVISHLEKVGKLLMDGLNELFSRFGVKAKAHRYPSLFHIIFEHIDFEEIFYKKVHFHGVLLHPFDPQMVNYSHTDEDIREALEKIKSALDELKEEHPQFFYHKNPLDLSQEAINFRTFHEFGGSVQYRLPLSEVVHTWDQQDR
jgi:glutamate-1-semialdehyde 2,1-aminomutase